MAVLVFFAWLAIVGLVLCLAFCYLVFKGLITLVACLVGPGVDREFWEEEAVDALCSMWKINLRQGKRLLARMRLPVEGYATEDEYIKAVIQESLEISREMRR